VRRAACILALGDNLCSELPAVDVLTRQTHGPDRLGAQGGPSRRVDCIRADNEQQGGSSRPLAGRRFPLGTRLITLVAGVADSLQAKGKVVVTMHDL
jgi:hypothetical protein